MSNTLGGSFKTVLTNIAKKQIAEKQIAIYDYCDEDDFKKLWALGNNNFDHIHKRHIIIVWDGRGWSGERNENLLSPHLTPMDWALAFSIETLPIESELDISIYIADLTGEKHDDEWAMQMRHQLLVEMPWIKLYAPLIPEKDGKSVRIRQGYNPIIDPASSNGGSTALLELKYSKFTLAYLSDWGSPLGNSQRSKKTNEEVHSKGPPRNQQIILKLSKEILQEAQTSDSRNRLIKLAKQWSATLTQSKDHHDINNVIGPSLLGRNQLTEDTDTEDLLRGAFHNRLLWCGSEVPQSIIEQWSPNEEELFNKPLSVLIVDDHLKEGWGKFICSSILNKGFISTDCNSKLKKINDDETMNIYGCTGPAPLIEFLENAKFTCRDFTQQIPVPCGENGDEISPQVILLDLRFPDLDKKAVKKLLKLLKYLLHMPKELAWRPAIKKKEINDIKAWCKGNTNDKRIADKALLLLPRLLAMALPLTPIILFSSTGQAWIKETLKPYQNIITGFEKPRVLSNPETVENSIAVLREALDKAVKMMSLQLQLAHAQKAVEVADKSRQNGLNDHHIEIYADETGDPNHIHNIVSGLAVCVFKDRKASQLLQNKLECEHRKGKGVVWAKNLKKNNKPLLEKGIDLQNNVENQVDLVCERLLGNNIDRSNWSVIATRCEISQPEQVSLASFPDAALDAALCFNIEFSLFVLIPYLSEEKFQGTIDIHLPTRVLPATKALMKFAQAFVLYRIPGIDKVRVWPEDAGFPLIRGWLAGWGNGAPLSLEKVQGLNMTSLGKGTDKGIGPEDAKKRRLFHDIADWVCTASIGQPNTYGEKLRKQLKQKDVFKHWHVSDETNNTDNARVLMQALRTSSNSESKGQDSDVLRLLLQNTYIAECNKDLLNDKKTSQQRLILWALRKELNDAKGQTLHLLCV